MLNLIHNTETGTHTCPACEAELKHLNLTRHVIQDGVLHLENLWFEKESTDEDEVESEEAYCPECGEPINTNDM